MFGKEMNLCSKLQCFDMMVGPGEGICLMFGTFRAWDLIHPGTGSRDLLVVNGGAING